MKKISPPNLLKKTRRLTIRPLEKLDYYNWAQCYSNLLPPQNTWDETNWDPSELSPKKFAELLKHQNIQRKLDQSYDFGVFRNSDGALVGTVHLMDISRGIFQNAYLGYRIFNIYWGEGYAQESCAAVIQFAFRTLKLHRVEAGISPANKLSLNTAFKIGMREEGLSKKRLKFQNKWTDVLIFALTKEDL